MEEDEDLRRKLLRAANINTIGSTNKKLGKLTENYYPVDDSVEYESFNDSEEMMIMKKKHKNQIENN